MSHRFAYHLRKDADKKPCRSISAMRSAVYIIDRITNFARLMDVPRLLSVHNLVAVAEQVIKFRGAPLLPNFQLAANCMALSVTTASMLGSDGELSLMFIVCYILRDS